MGYCALGITAVIVFIQRHGNGNNFMEYFEIKKEF